MTLLNSWTGRTACALQAALRMTNESFAAHLNIAVRTVATWHQKSDLTPRPEMQQILDSALERASENERARFENQLTDLRKGESVSVQNQRALIWIVEHSDLNIEQVYDAVARHVGVLRRGQSSVDREKDYLVGKVTRGQVANAVQRYYGDSGVARYYTARVDDNPVSLSVIAKPEWLDLGIKLGEVSEDCRLNSSAGSILFSLDGKPLEGAISRLASAEAAKTLFFGTPCYRLVGISPAGDTFRVEFAVADSVSYILTLDLLERELIDAIALRGVIREQSFPLREHYLPTLVSALQFENRLCAGGQQTLIAAARPVTRRGPREPDFVFLVQERSARVMNMAGRLALIPKSFHEPTINEAEDVLLSSTVEREFEEELLGRPELENSPLNPLRRADPLHHSELSEPMQWLDARRGTDSYHLECSGFGINMVSGNYEFSCLMIIDDEEWWARYGGQIEANWEAGRIRRYSSRDRGGLATLIQDPAWSNEGLFAFLTALRRFSVLKNDSRISLPSIEVDA